jgi:hypothetical protein
MVDCIPYTIRGLEGDVAERLDDYYGGDAWWNVVGDAVRRLPIPHIDLLVDIQADLVARRVADYYCDRIHTLPGQIGVETEAQRCSKVNGFHHRPQSYCFTKAGRFSC